MRLALFSNQHNAQLIKKLLNKYAQNLTVIYVFEESGIKKEYKDYYQFNCRGDDSYSFLYELSIDAALVYGWNYKIPFKWLEAVPFYNIHPSLLPKYRGPDPITFQLLSREKQSGVTIHAMNQAFDSGPMCRQKELVIDYNDEVNIILLKFSRCINLVLEEFLSDLLNNTITLTPQNNKDANYFTYHDLKIFTITNNTTYADFFWICGVLKNKYPVKVFYENRVRILASFSLQYIKNSVEYRLVEGCVYFTFFELEEK